MNASLPFYLLCGFLVLLWIAGGASRADTTGQAVVRAAAWATLFVAVVAGLRPAVRKARAVYLIFAATVGLVILYLVPLPSDQWLRLPGRAALDTAGGAGAWRPLAIVPDGALNALFSLVVPFAMLVLVCCLDERERMRMPALMLGMVVATMMVGLLQFSGISLTNPFINDGGGDVSGNFANRNHFALFLSFGCLLAPAWAFMDGRAGWRAPAAFSLMLLFTLGILGSGSRAGMLTGCLGIMLGLWSVQDRIRRELRHAPRWTFPFIVAGMVATIGIVVFVSFTADRAVSIDRAVSLSAGEDLRALSLPVTIAMVEAQFPLGSGFGGFDQVYRMYEPDALLMHLYQNHAHNDFVEIVLEGGLAGLAVLAVTLAWWGSASWKAWRTKTVQGRLGSGTLLLVLLASIVDYPARSPMIMAVVAVSALWLSWATCSGCSALPADGEQL